VVMVRLLGPVELVRHGQPVDIGPPQRRLVLAALAVDAGRPVPLDTLVERVWGPEAPSQGGRAVQAHLTRIRQLAKSLDEPLELSRRSGGYALEAAPEAVDAHLLRMLVGQAREPGRDAAERTRLLRAAVELVRGEPLAGLPGHWAEQTRENLRRQYLDAAVAWASAEIAAGAPEMVFDRLSTLVDRHPLVEPLAAAYLRALHAAGQTAAALEHYARTRQRLVDDLGIEPGAELRQAHLAVLQGKPASPAPTPAQLPADVTGFAGRTAQLDRLDALLAGAGTPVAVTISGTAGVGKTALAVHWAHRVRGRFPDGQLYLNLAGYDPGGSLVTATQAVRGLLTGLGVPAQQIPPALAEQTALYRSLLAGRRMLVLLDNARDAEHARPLLPGTAGSLALVTSRDGLGGLIAEGAYPVVLDLLSPAESADLLARRIGRPRIVAEPRAVDAIVASCAGLPLALAVVAVRAATNPTFSMAALAGELRHALDALHAGDPASDVRAVLSWSYQALSAAAARLFRLLGLHGGPDIGVAAAASLIGEPVRRARPLLAELARAHLLMEQQPGRYSMHDLLRAYAAELCDETDSPDDRRDAIGRALDHLVHTGYTAAMLLHPTREPIELAAPRPGVVPAPLDDYEQAQNWFVTEHRVLQAAVRRGADDRLTWQLVWTMTTYLLRRGHWQDWVDVQRAALAAARRLDDRAAQAAAHRGLGRALGALGQADEADAEYRRALRLYRRLGDAAGQATTHDNLSFVLFGQGRYADALAHVREAIALYRAADRTDGLASASNSAAWLLTQLGEPAAAIGHGEESLVLHRAIGDRDGEAATWDTLGFAHHHLGDWPAADDSYRRALELYRELGDRYNVAATLAHLGDTQEAAGDPEAARRSWREALAGFEAIGHPEAEDVRNRLG
jgi:DNA-binding SARP family transcriptional activator/tetratricopeptide (TPR) repeat protein